jgi:hypothetical protein
MKGISAEVLALRSAPVVLASPTVCQRSRLTPRSRLLDKVLALTGFLERLLFQVKPTDVTTFVLVSGRLLAADRFANGAALRLTGGKKK